MKMNKRKIELIIAFLIIIIVTISLFIIFKKDSQDFVYKGEKGEYKFDIQQIGTVTFYRPHVFVGGKEYIYAFRNKPQNLEELPLESGILNKLNRQGGLKELYITKDVNLSSQIEGNVNIVTAPMASILGKTDFGIYRIRVNSAYTSFHSGEPVAPTVDCSTVNYNGKVNKTVGVVYLKLGNDNKIYSEGDCIIIEGKDSDGLIKAGEKFAYHLIGVF